MKVDMPLRKKTNKARNSVTGIRTSLQRCNSCTLATTQRRLFLLYDELMQNHLLIYIYIDRVSSVWFYGQSTIVGYLMPNPVYTYILDLYDLSNQCNVSLTI